MTVIKLRPDAPLNSHENARQKIAALHVAINDLFNLPLSTLAKTNFYDLVFDPARMYPHGVDVVLGEAAERLNELQCQIQNERARRSYDAIEYV